MRAPVGELASLVNDYINLGSRELSGVEFAFQYRMPQNDFGQFVLKGEATHYFTRDEELSRDGVVGFQLGKNGRAEWRGNLAMSWNRGPWAAAWFTSYYGAFADTSASETETIYNRAGPARPHQSDGCQRHYALLPARQAGHPAQPAAALHLPR
ncbi:MAG: TonB-dependent receptor [Candidatus Synoicihabitans palmerolidicus]|nr:TonB-dependent receptor [Candidatus Synoicihabitans palmerolidicus]